MARWREPAADRVLEVQHQRAPQRIPCDDAGEGIAERIDTIAPIAASAALPCSSRIQVARFTTYPTSSAVSWIVCALNAASHSALCSFAVGVGFVEFRPVPATCSVPSFSQLLGWRRT